MSRSGVLKITSTDKGWFRLEFSNKYFVSQVIKKFPVGTKQFNNRRWEVAESQLVLLVVSAKKYFAHVDYSSLSGAHQMAIAVGVADARNYHKDTDTTAVNIRPDCPYATLYLLNSAPFDIVKVVYRHLSRAHHPDGGGDESAFKRINRAYEEIKRAEDASNDEIDGAGAGG